MFPRLTRFCTVLELMGQDATSLGRSEDVVVVEEDNCRICVLLKISYRSRCWREVCAGHITRVVEAAFLKRPVVPAFIMLDQHASVLTQAWFCGWYTSSKKIEV